MILVWLILIPLIGAVVSLAAARISDNWARWVAATTLIADLALGLTLWLHVAGAVNPLATGGWIDRFQVGWIPRFGIHFQLGLDGLSLTMVMLTLFLGLMSVITSWREIRERVGFFHFNLLASLAGTLGVFLALDLFLFFSFWEVMLVPMYLLIAIWGHENRRYAAIKFFLFTQASGLLMLASILALVLVHQAQTHVLTFNYFRLLNTQFGGAAGLFMMLGFFLAFAVKLPAVPFHTWLPDAHTEAPTAGSVILAGVLLKTGAYGLIRFTVPLFPQAAHWFAPFAMALGVAGIIYGGVVAFGQRDLKRLVAYTSISHLGFVLLGIFAWTEIALQGAVIQMIAHGISTGALFMMVGALQERLHTRKLAHMGGLWPRVPRMAAIGLFFAVASLGLPGLGNFVGEFMALLGTYPVSIPATAFAATGVIVAAVYTLFWMQKTFQGSPRHAPALGDFGAREMGMMAAMIVVIVWIGVYPQFFINTLHPALAGLRSAATVAGG